MDSKWTVGEFFTHLSICNRIVVQWVSTRRVVHEYYFLTFTTFILNRALSWYSHPHLLAYSVLTCARR